MENEDMTLSEFTSRFTDHLIKQAGTETFADGSPIRDYAVEVAPEYFNDPENLPLNPEECADIDMDYWEP